jgi:hypothetical protein
MQSKLLICAVALAGAAFFSRPARADDWSQAGKARVLMSSEGIVATMVPIKAQGDTPRVALLVEGTMTKLDGRVRLLLVKEQGRGADFVTVDPKGKEGGIALLSREVWSSTRSFTLTVPGRRDGIAVYWNPKRSEKVDTTRILNRLLLRRLGKPGARGELDKQDQQAVAQAAQSAGAACKTTIKAELQARSFNDQAHKVLDVGAACSAALKAIESLCDDDVGRGAVKQKIKTVSCSLGTSPAVELRGGKVLFTTALDTPGQEDWVKEQLLNKL